MTISTQQALETFLGNNSAVTFSFNFIYDSADVITAIYTDGNGNSTTLSPTQYTLFLNPPAVGQLWGIGGTITYPTVGSPIANETSLTVARNLPLTQNISISNQGNFAPEVIEEGLDILEMQIQQVSGRTGQFRGTWLTSTFYNYGDYVIDGSNGANTGNYYMAVIPNTSGVWATDLANGDWVIVIDVRNINTIASAAAASAAAASASASTASTAATTSTTEAGIATSAASSASSSAASAAASATAAASFGSTLTGTSTTSNTIGTGAKTFTTQTGLTFVSGGFVVVVDQASSANYMHGQVTSYSGSTLILNITDIGGSGTKTAWNILLSGTQGPTGATGATGPTPSATVTTVASSATPTVDLSLNRNFKYTTAQNTTFTFSNPDATGTNCSFAIFLFQDSTGRTITWPGTVRWSNGIVPVLTTANAIYTLTFSTIDGGSSYYGYLTGEALA